MSNDERSFFSKIQTARHVNFRLVKSITSNISFHFVAYFAIRHWRSGPIEPEIS
jgi:hypothetical protein